MPAILRVLGPRFIRIHRSYIANMDMITAYNDADSTIKIDDEELPVGKTYRKKLKESLNLYN